VVSDEIVLERTRWRGGKRLRDGHTLYWWVEVLVVMAGNLVYESIRNANTTDVHLAYQNALKIIDWQQALWLNHEQTWQRWALEFEPLVIAGNYFYGSAYILVTLFALVFLYRRFPDDYPFWRNTLFVGTFVGLVGFAAFPLMPPRLLSTMDPSWVFVDTLDQYPTFWSFNSEAMAKISNQYAAMPSLHCGWAFWGCAVFLPRVRKRWAKVLAVAYPVVTVTVVVISANHFFLDAVGGAFIMVVGLAASTVFTRAGRPAPALDPVVIDTTSGS